MSPALQRLGRRGDAAAADSSPEASTTVDLTATEARAVGQRLGELLVGHAYVSGADVEGALVRQTSAGGRLGALLRESGVLSEDHLVAVLAEQMKLPVIDLGGITPEPDALAKVPETVARKYSMVPLRVHEDGYLMVAVAEPEPGVAKQLAEVLQIPVAVGIASQRQVQHSLNGCYRALDGIDSQVDKFVQTLRDRPNLDVEESASSANSPVVAIVERILTQALRDRASDIHIEPQDTRLRVRYRIDGALKEALDLPSELGAGLISRIKILAGMNIVERRRPQDGQLSTRVDGRDIDVRVSTTATIWGENCVMRLLDKNRSLLRLDDLGMPEQTHADFAHLARSPFGMVLCAGPTGSGKTTTLYAALAELNEPHRNIMTIEDPVEYVLPSINQIQMNETAGITFATGLKSILRQDPDVILVGEIRDVETARIAVQSALTGHFVLSSLHATNAVSALHRFLDMGIESFLVASSVLGVVGQRLVRRICPHCKTKYDPSDEELAFFREQCETVKTSFYMGAGCTYCSGTGYLDRIGVYEFLRITPEIRRLVVGWATQDELAKLAASQGMRTLEQEAIALIEQDTTTIHEVMRAIYAF